MKHQKIAIIGAGATGLAAAYKLSKEGHRITVFEKNDEIAGLAASIEVQGTKLERYYHHLFSTDKEFISVVNELGLEDNLYFVRPPTGIYYKNKQHPFGTPFEMLRFSPIPFIDRLRFAIVSGYLRARKHYRKLAPKNALVWSRHFMGERTTKVIWEPLLRNKFGSHADSISMAWLWARVHIRTFKLGYMKGGFDQVYEAMAKKITDNGGEILTRQDIQSINQKNKNSPVIIRFSNGKTKRFDKLIATVPQPVFARMVGAPYDDEVWKAQYLGATCFVLETKKSLTPYYWLNINEPNFPFLAIIEQTRFLDPKHYGGRHIVYIGNYVSTDDKRYNTDPKELLKSYLPYIQKVSPKFKESDILQWHFSKAPFAQPIVTPSYHETIPKHTTSLPGVWLATMSQVYPIDRGQNYAFKMGFEVADLATKE